MIKAKIQQFIFNVGDKLMNLAETRIKEQLPEIQAQLEAVVKEKIPQLRAQAEARAAKA